MAARMVSGVRRSEHITLVFEDLHWLPVSQRVVFKMALMVWKCVHGVAPVCLSDLCVPATAISGRQHLRSAATGTLLVPRARTATGQRSFAVNGPVRWNRLPPALRSPDLSESAFKRALKTHLFSTARRHWDVFILAPDINIQTFLLTYSLTTVQIFTPSDATYLSPGIKYIFFFIWTPLGVYRRTVYIFGKLSSSQCQAPFDM